MNPEVSPRELNGGPTLGDAPDSNEEDTKHVDLEPANAADTFSSSNTILPHGMAHAMPLREASFTSSNEAILSPELVVIGLGRKRDPVKINKQEEVKEALDNVLKVHNEPVWVDFRSLKDEDIEFVGRELKLDPLTIDDLNMSFEDLHRVETNPSRWLEREKLEFFEQGYFYLQFHALDASSEEGGAVPLKMVVVGSHVFTFHSEEIPVLNRVLLRLPLVLPPTSELVYLITKAVMSTYFGAVESVMADIRAIERLVETLSRSEQSDLLKRISNARKFLTRVQHEIEPKHGIISSMMHSNLFPNKHNMHDLLDLCVVLTRRLDYASNILESLQAFYITRISLDLNSSNNALTETMNKLTLVATITLPLSLVASLFGMNVTVPFETEGPTDDTPAFWGIVGVMALAIVFSWWYFKRQRLL